MAPSEAAVARAGGERVRASGNCFACVTDGHTCHGPGYLADLKAEAQAVEKRLSELRR
jgi:hypothetical protein